MNAGPYFISFIYIDKDISYCKGWKKGDNTSGAIKWNIKIKKDEWDEFWFDYDYYGTDQEIEYTITYRYEVIDSLLHFSNTEGQEFNSIQDSSCRCISLCFVERQHYIQPIRNNHEVPYADIADGHPQHNKKALTSESRS